MQRSLFDRIGVHIPAILLLSVVTAALYWQALGHGFLVYWDDNGYVTGNAAIRGITWTNIKTAFTAFYEGNYAPLQILSYMIDYDIWGLQPRGFIVTNILIHVVNGILFYTLLIRLSWQRLPACLAALIFLVHPAQVESVVWISQRKNLLAMLFFLLSFYSYILYRDTSEKRQLLLYGASLVAFILALLSKSVAVILPLVLMGYDFLVASRHDRRAMIVDKIPYFISAFVIALVAMKSQSVELAAGGGRTSFHGGSPYATLLTMLPVFVRYVGIALWPLNLSAVYAPAIKTAIDFEVARAGLLLSLIALLGVVLYYRRRDILFWLLLFFLGLLPVSQIVPIVTLMNDRYFYFPLLGASACIVAVAFLVIRNTAKGKTFVKITAGVFFFILLGHFLIESSNRIPVWRNEHALWEDAVKKVPSSSKAHFQFAHILEHEGEFDKAEKQYKLGLNLTSAHFERYPLARLYEKMGRWDNAIEEYQRFLEQSPGFLDARNNLAFIYINKGKLDQAAEQYEAGLRYKPDWAEGYNNLAVISLKKGNKSMAIEHFREAVKLNPRDPDMHYNLGLLYCDQGMEKQGLQEFETAASLNPGNPLFTKKLSEVSEKVKRRGGN